MGILKTPRLAAGLAKTHAAPDYGQRVDAERRFFSGCQDLYALPLIYGYWSDKYLRPQLETFGSSHPEAMFADYFQRAATASMAKIPRFVSLGSGNCETEIRIAQQLIKWGMREFTIECIEMNEGLLADGAKRAKDAGVGAFVHPAQGDLNYWMPEGPCDAVLANNSLHHVSDLEHLFDAIQQGLRPSGTFVTSDMIGRNGHMRWPEALSIVQEFWRELPHSKRYNHLLRRHEHEYENWDCSSDGFEGIRAQDILPLLIAYFEFDFFLPFANVIDPFIDRTFGPNFDIHDPADLDLIDRIHGRDEGEILSGAIKPTHILAAMCAGRSGRNLSLNGLTPDFSVRSPVRVPQRTLVINAPTSGDSASGIDSERKTIPINYTDLWWNPAESGWGISIHHHSSNALVACWLVYGADGSPCWFLIQPGEWIDAQTFHGVIYQSTGPDWKNLFETTRVERREVGTGVLAFDGPQNGTFSFTIDGVDGNKTISRMSF
jgi:SAM-dependent methyltransferase